MGRRTLHLLVMSCFVLVVWTTSAGALQLDAASGTCVGTYPPSAQSLSLELDPTAGPAGSAVTVSGQATSGGATLSILFDNAVIGTATAGSTGPFNATVTIPAGATAGAHTITVSGAGCLATATFAVPAPAVAGLAFTGSNLYGLLEVAAGLALLGAVLVVVTRRRRAASRLVEG